MGLLWLSGFVLGASLFTPISSFTLAIDYYNTAFPGESVPAKILVCYEVAFVLMQIVCHLADSRLPISRAARIELRHLLLAGLVAFVIIWDRVLIGPDLAPPAPPYALPLLLAVVTLCGVLDGAAIGAVFGEAAVLGPNIAHAVVAGTAGVLPLLAVLRITFKAALPQNEWGLRLSVCAYFATACLVLLLALGVYLCVVLPAVASLAHALDEPSLASPAGRNAQRELSTMPLVPTLGAGRAGGPALSYALPNSMRGSSLLVRRVCTHLPPSQLRIGSIAGAVDWMASHQRLAPTARSYPHQDAGSCPKMCKASSLPRSPSATPWAAPAKLSRSQTAPHSRGWDDQGGSKDQPPSLQLSVGLSSGGKLSSGLDSAATAVSALVIPEESSFVQPPRAQGLLGVGAPHHAAAAAEHSSRHSSSSSSSVRDVHGRQQQQQHQNQQQDEEQPPSAFAALAGKSWTLSAAPGSVGSGGRGRLASRPSMRLAELRAASSKSSAIEALLREAQHASADGPLWAKPSHSVWRANWAALRANWCYAAATVLCYAANYLMYPAVISSVQPTRPELATWLPLLLVTTYGVFDLAGKLLPLWQPRRPQATVLGIAVARLLVFTALFAGWLVVHGGSHPAFFFVALAALAGSAFFEALVFGLACAGRHADDAYLVEGQLAIMIDVGICLGSAASLAWDLGWWAQGAGGASAAASHG